MNALRLSIAAALALRVCAPAFAGEVRFHGYAYELESGRYLYTEVHRARVDGERWLGGVTTYYAADGARLGRNTLDFAGDAVVPVYRLDLDAGYAEGIAAVDGDRIEMFRHGFGDRAVRTERVARPANATADAGIHNLLRRHFEPLLGGQRLRFHFVVPGNLDVFRFRARRIADGTFEDRPTVRFQLEPDTLLRLLAQPLELAYDRETRRLMEYRGRSNIHDPVTHEAYNVRISYFTKPPADAGRLPAGGGSEP